MVVRHEELDAHENRFDARDNEEDERVADVHQADLFVIDSGDPILQLIEPAVLEGWIDGDLSLRRHGFLVLRNLSEASRGTGLRHRDRVG